MRLYFKQRIFTWLDSYDIYNEAEEIVFTVEGKMAWGHRLVIYDASGNELGEIKEEIMRLLPKFRMYVNHQEIGVIEKEWSFFKPRFHLTCNDWSIEGDIWQWNYHVTSYNKHIMSAYKELLHLSDTYVMDIEQEADMLYCLMIVLAIDAAKCSSN